MRFLREELIAEGFPGGVGIRGRPIQPNLEPMKKQVGIVLSYWLRRRGANARLQINSIMMRASPFLRPCLSQTYVTNFRSFEMAKWHKTLLFPALLEKTRFWAVGLARRWKG
jgi:hypothetical protein